MVHQRQARPYVFILMPFNAEFHDTYESGIKLACKAAGVACERVDDQSFDETILQRILGQIRKADAIVADMSGRNPNVFYEVGYAHALQKRVILLTRDAADIPFDLKHHQHIVYEGKSFLLRERLTKKLKWCFQTPMPDIDFQSDRPIIRRITRILEQVAKTVSTRSSLGPLLKNVLEEMTEILDAEVCSIFLNDPKEPDVIRCVAGSGFAEAIVGKAEYRSGEGLTGKIFSSGQTRIVGSREELQRTDKDIGWLGKWDHIQWAAYGGKSQFRNCIAAPLKIGDKPIGIIKVENKRAGTFTKDDVDILEAITTGVLSMAIHNARLRQDVTAVQLKIEELQKSKDFSQKNLNQLAKEIVSLPTEDRSGIVALITNLAAPWAKILLKIIASLLL